MKGWYMSVADHAPPPDRLTIKQITVEWVVLYRHVPPTRENIPTYVEHFWWMTWYLRIKISSGGPEGETHVLTKVLGVLPQGVSAEAPKN